MKKSILVFLLLGIFPNFCNASKIPFNDAESVEAEFKRLEKIETYISKNEGVTLESIKANKPELLDGLELETFTNTTAFSLKGDLPGNFPPFAWGCCLGVIGIAAVYFTTDNDKDMVKKAFFGCLVNGALLGGGCLLYSLLGNGYYY